MATVKGEGEIRFVLNWRSKTLISEQKKIWKER
jgi:hypothetical protein